jgi:hypothetical protein
MQFNGHLRTKLPRPRKANDNEPRPVRYIVGEISVEAGKNSSADGANEQCRLAFPTKVDLMMRRCGPSGFGAMMERWRLPFS